jgi:molybdopterin molybdotransferase
VTFDSVLIVDWSGGNDRGLGPKADAIWTCVAQAGQAQDPVYHRNRQVAEDWITRSLDAECRAGRRVLAGFDFAFGFPAGFGQVLTGSNDPFAIWDYFAARITDTPKANNRFDLAGQINAQFPGIGPFWGNGLTRDIPDLPRKGRARQGHGMTEKRATELQAKGSFAVWQLSGAGAVGSQVFMGLPMLARLRGRFGADLTVWPFQPATGTIVLAEVWPSLIAPTIAADPDGHRIKDARQVQVLARALSALAADDLAKLMDVPASGEGVILGLGHQALLDQAARAKPLRNDCFALPQGVHWTPVDQALDHLRQHLRAVTQVESCTLGDALGRYLAQDVTAARAHPPAANAAVDGYGFAGPAMAGPQKIPLVTGQAAAGGADPGPVPAGHAIRILTGAALPAGVDTVLMQEDAQVADGILRFTGPLRQGSNTRAAGEDMQTGQIIAKAGRRITPADLAMMAAAGLGSCPVHRALRVGVLSTGDELADPGTKLGPRQIADANRVMLLGLLQHWGFAGVDLGRAPDDPAAIRAKLDQGAADCDVILTSGGASAGDADHMSALLKDAGDFALWRVAMKPGRPLAMGLWRGVPVLGLPGNPVAAFVCTLVFASPALTLLAGGSPTAPQGFSLPAAFSKSKKRGRREYLRARIRDGQAEVFTSEGSGRITGLSWAEGLVVLDDAAQDIRPGDPVTFIPYAGFAP